jgi:hypothetical protein
VAAIVDDLVVEAGATFSKAYRYLQATPDELTGIRPPVDLAGWTASLQVRAHPKSATTIVDTVPVIDVPTGTIPIVMTAQETALLTATGAVWALELAAPGGEPVVRLVKGRVLVDPETVR